MRIELAITVFLLYMFNNKSHCCISLKELLHKKRNYKKRGKESTVLIIFLHDRMSIKLLAKLPANRLFRPIGI